jgi:hypothetical protein
MKTKEKKQKTMLLVQAQERSAGSDNGLGKTEQFYRVKGIDTAVSKPYLSERLDDCISRRNAVAADLELNGKVYITVVSVLRNGRRDKCAVALIDISTCEILGCWPVFEHEVNKEVFISYPTSDIPFVNLPTDDCCDEYHQCGSKVLPEERESFLNDAIKGINVGLEPLGMELDSKVVQQMKEAVAAQKEVQSC